MVVEEREYMVCEDGTNVSEGINVGEGHPFMWKGLVQLHGTTENGGEGGIAVHCDLETFRN